LFKNQTGILFKIVWVKNKMPEILNILIGACKSDILFISLTENLTQGLPLMLRLLLLTNSKSIMPLWLHTRITS